MSEQDKSGSKPEKQNRLQKGLTALHAAFLKYIGRSISQTPTETSEQNVAITTPKPKKGTPFSLSDQKALADHYTRLGEERHRVKPLHTYELNTTDGEIQNFDSTFTREEYEEIVQTLQNRKRDSRMLKFVTDDASTVNEEGLVNEILSKYRIDKSLVREAGRVTFYPDGSIIIENGSATFNDIGQKKPAPITTARFRNILPDVNVTDIFANQV